jgi:thiol:disulfide interchange protein DsbD
LAYAKSVKKPILLDFTGYACVNCRKMEDFVWSDPAILKIQNEVVLISLYVDDKRELPKSEQYVSKETGKEIVSVK